MVVNGNKADSQKRKYLLQIRAHFHIIPAKAGQIFYHHAIKLLISGILQKTLHPRAVEIRPRKSVILVFHNLTFCKTGCYILPYQNTLHGNTVTFLPHGFICFGKAHIDGNADCMCYSLFLIRLSDSFPLFTHAVRPLSPICHFHQHIIIHSYKKQT